MRTLIFLLALITLAACNEDLESKGHQGKQADGTSGSLGDPCDVSTDRITPGC